jgi:hypothetical protein
MTNKEMWESNEPVKDVKGFDMELPGWIDADISPYDIAAIDQGGCGSGAYMPAVKYSDALKTMYEHGDEVRSYIEDRTGELPALPKYNSWSEISVYYLSCAVELWAYEAYCTMENLTECEDDED